MPLSFPLAWMRPAALFATTLCAGLSHTDRPRHRPRQSDELADGSCRPPALRAGGAAIGRADRRGRRMKSFELRKDRGPDIAGRLQRGDVAKWHGVADGPAFSLRVRPRRRQDGPTSRIGSARRSGRAWYSWTLSSATPSSRAVLAASKWVTAMKSLPPNALTTPVADVGDAVGCDRDAHRAAGDGQPGKPGQGASAEMGDLVLPRRLGTDKQQALVAAGAAHHAGRLPVVGRERELLRVGIVPAPDR
jgi:hypothetical protein